MKKVLLLVGIFAVGYYAFGNKSNAPANEMIEQNEDIFVKYNNRIVSDINGYWMIIRDGKIFSAKGGTVQDWYDANPTNTEIVNAPEDIWIAYNDYYGGIIS